jgi:hypothetical protein
VVYVYDSILATSHIKKALKAIKNSSDKTINV